MHSATCAIEFYTARIISSGVNQKQKTPATALQEFKWSKDFVNYCRGSLFPLSLTLPGSSVTGASTGSSISGSLFKLVFVESPA